MTIKDEVAEFAKRITALGFAVYVAEDRTYGFVTDEKESRVLSFSFTNCGYLSGSYGPPTTMSGSGWRMDEDPRSLTSKDKVKAALYAMPPPWAGNGWRYFTTVAQHMKQYDSSSHYTRFVADA